MQTLIPILLLLPLVAVAGYLVLEYSFLVPFRKGLPILMYHRILEGPPDRLTVTPGQLDLHLMYLKERGYRTLTFRELKALHDKREPLPARSIILTFDDAFVNFRELALPLLERYGFTATLFVPVAFIGKTNIWDQGGEPILPAADLKQISGEGRTEIGLHSFLHKNYSDMTAEDMQEDLKNCMETLSFYGIPFSRVLAYPYGGYPQKDPDMAEPVNRLFAQAGLDFALRVGNRLNPWPLKDRYLLKRTDVRGTDSFRTFRIKVKKGRAKLFA